MRRTTTSENLVYFLESEKKRIEELTKKNDRLEKKLVDEVKKLPVISEPESIKERISEPMNEIHDNPILKKEDYEKMKILRDIQMNFVLTDPTIPDNPIVYASPGFLALTGYGINDVLFRNCRFLQGPNTDRETVNKIRQAIKNRTHTTVCIQNYDAEGEVFWNQFTISPLLNSVGEVTNYIGIQCKVSDEYAKLFLEDEKRQ